MPYHPSCPVYQPTAAPALPPRPRHPLPPWRWLWTARDNLLATWSEGAFVAGTMEYRLPGRRMFLANSAESVRHVLVSNATNYRKSADTRRMLQPLVGNGLFISEGQTWSHQRRLILPSLHQHLLPGHFGVMGETAGEMLERWRATGDRAELDLSREMTRVTADVVCRALLSTRLGEERSHAVYDAFNDYQASLGRFDVFGFAGLPDWVPRPGAGRGREAVARLDAIVDGIINDHARGGQRPAADLLDLLLATSSTAAEGEAAPAVSPRDEAKVLFLAGHETTASALCWAFHLLSIYPEVEAKVYAEARRVLPGRGAPDLDHIAGLAYTQAVVEETLRLYPPLHVLGREAISPDRLGGRNVPAGSLVVVAPWVLHRHRRYWPHPDRFQPERFLPAWRDETRPRHCYIPFGAGRRVCPGGVFGLTEATLILAMVVRRFRLRPAPGHRIEPIGRLTLRPRHGLWMRLEAR